MNNNNIEQNKIKVENIDKQNENDEINNKKDRIIHMTIQNNFLSANCQYIKHNNTRSSKNIKSKENEEQEKGRKYSNKDLLNPLIHFTNLSSKKLKILGSISNK